MMDDLIGLPFADKGRGNPGYDCFGLVAEIYRRRGKTLPDYGIDHRDPLEIQYTIKKEIDTGKWIKLKSPEKFCIILMQQHPFFVQHVAMYIGAGKFIHSSLHKGVTVDRLNDPFYKNTVRGFYKYAG